MPTALELGREGWGRFLRGVSRPLPPELTPSERSDRERLLKHVREAATALKTQFGVRRVVLFGSLAHEGWFASDSDVDLAVEGLSSDDYWQAWKLAEDIIGDRPVDFIEIETCRESLRRAIRRYGVEL
jgi:predicted nucleotidyltransferase